MAKLVTYLLTTMMALSALLAGALGGNASGTTTTTQPEDDGCIFPGPCVLIPKVHPLSKQEDRKVLIQDCWVSDFDYYLTDGTFDESEEGFGLFNATLEVVNGNRQILANVEQGPDDVGYAWCEEVASYGQ